MIKFFKSVTSKYLGVYSISTIVFLTSYTGLFAQAPSNPPSGAPTTPPSNPPGFTTGNPCWDTACIPIDGGVIFLLLAGGILGAKLIYSFSQKTNQ